MSDSQGHYRFSGVEPGKFTLLIRADATQTYSRDVRLSSGQNLEGADIAVETFGSISGVVADADEAPVANVWVVLIQRAYRGGKTTYGQIAGTKTDSMGRYRLDTNVRPGRAYAVLAQPMPQRLPAISAVPEDPERRQPALVATAFPNAPFVDGAPTVVLRSGQALDKIDIRMARSKSYCAQGVMLAEGKPASMDFEVSDPLVFNGGLAGTGGFSMTLPRGTTGSDGKFRICDLHSGEYLLRAVPPGAFNSWLPPAVQAVAPFAIADRDLSDLRVNAVSGRSVFGEVIWDGGPPALAPGATARIFVTPASENRTLRQVESPVPGRFVVDGLWMEDYEIRVALTSPGSYVKDVTYGGASERWRRFAPGSAEGASLKVILAADGGTIAAKVADEDGNAVPSASVCFLPAVAGAPAELEMVLTCAKTDSEGWATSGTLAPGRYSILATTLPLDRSAGTLDRLWGARLKGYEVNLPPQGTKQVSLKPVPLN